MREILFRGKRNIGEWIYGYFIIANDGNTAIVERKINNNILSVVPETVGQYTGLTDKNGKKIFEGDYDADGNCIVWCDNCNGFEFAALDVPTKDICISCHRCDGNFFFGDQINDFEIVGNVAD